MAVRRNGPCSTYVVLYDSVEQTQWQALPDLRRPCQQPPSNPHRMDDRQQRGEEGWNAASTVMPSIAWLFLLGRKVVFAHLSDVAYHICPTRWVRVKAVC